MKKILHSAILIALGFMANAQNVTIPDANFKSALLNHSPIIDTDDDDEISITEAEAFTGQLNVGSKGISDLTGIESFTNMTILNCSNNNLTSLNISNNSILTTLICNQNQLTSLTVNNNPAMTYLSCTFNQLTNLDISTCAALQYFSCARNQLTVVNVSNNLNLNTIDCSYNPVTSLNVSQNLALSSLSCGNSSLTELDVSLNTALAGLQCRYGQLESLNIANGANWQLIWAEVNPNLTCIQVSNALYSTANWTGVYFSFDTGVSFSENCATASIEELNTNRMMIHPNPVRNSLNVDIKENIAIKIVDVLGKVILTVNSKAGNNTIDVSNLPSGVYVITTETGENLKFVKE